MTQARSRYLILAISCSLLALPGCGGYGKVSPLAYEYAKALYSICNRRNPEKLVVVRQKVATSLEKEEISERESSWLGDIIAQAEAGEWKSAEQQARRLMEDQVKR